MGLDDLKRKKEKEEKWGENEKLKKRIEEEHYYSDIAERGKINLSHLQALEDSFWEFAEKLSNIINKEIQSYSKRKKILGLFSKSAIKTKDSYGEKRPCYPELCVSFKESDNSHNAITLVAKEGVIYFEGRHFQVHSLYSHSHISDSVDHYAEHKSELSLNEFSTSTAIKWLENQFVKYHDEYREGQRKEERRRRKWEAIT